MTTTPEANAKQLAGNLPSAAGALLDAITAARDIAQDWLDKINALGRTS